MFAVCVPAPVTRLPGSASGTCFADPHSPWSPPFAPLAPPQLPPPRIAPQGAPLCSPASPLVRRSPTSHARASSATAPHLPDADQVGICLWSDVGSPSFRRDPFARDVLFDPGGTTMPRITALHMLRSTMTTVSAPAVSSFRGSITHPTQPLCTLRVRRYRRLTQHSLPGGPLRPYLGRTFTG